jgi:uncharacterized protein (DUF433 family)
MYADRESKNRVMSARSWRSIALSFDDPAPRDRHDRLRSFPHAGDKPNASPSRASYATFALMGELYSLGVYSAADASRYMRLPASTVRWWLRRGERIRRADRALVTFDELISLLFVAELRRRDVGHRDILRAEDDLRERTGHDLPFVYQELWVAGKDVLIPVAPDASQFIAANRGGQSTFKDWAQADRVRLPELVQRARGQVEYADKRAVAWMPEPDIAVRPGVQFGLTCIAGTRIPTNVLAGAVEAGETPDAVAQLYLIAPEQVHEAVAWERGLAA